MLQLVAVLAEFEGIPFCPLDMSRLEWRRWFHSQLQRSQGNRKVRTRCVVDKVLASCHLRSSQRALFNRTVRMHTQQHRRPAQSIADHRCVEWDIAGTDSGSRWTLKRLRLVACARAQQSPVVEATAWRRRGQCCLQRAALCMMQLGVLQQEVQRH